MPDAELDQSEPERVSSPGSDGACATWDGAAVTIDLPTDRARQPRPLFRADREQLAVPPSVSARLDTVAARHGTDLSHLLLAAVEAWMFRLTGGEHVAVGITGRMTIGSAETARRDDSTVEPIAIVRCAIDRSRPFRELLESVRDRAIAAHAGDHREGVAAA